MTLSRQVLVLDWGCGLFALTHKVNVATCMCNFILIWTDYAESVPLLAIAQDTSSEDRKSGLGGLTLRAGWYPLQALPEKQEKYCVILKEFQVLFSLRNSHRNQWNFSTFPTQLLLLKNAGVSKDWKGCTKVPPHQGSCAEGLHPEEAQGDMLREAYRLLPVFEGTKHVYIMTYLQQPASFGTLVLLKLCPSQAFSLEHQESR